MFLIIGGTGALGSAATRLLLQRGHKVRVMTRNPQSATALKKLGAEVVQGDLRDKASLARACDRVDGVLAAAHSIMGRGAESSVQVDSLGHKWLINVAQEAGVRHFVYTSAFGVSPTHPAEFYRIKHEVEQYLQHSGLAHTILRPTAFMESHAHMLIGQPILEKGKVQLFGQGENPRNFVAAQDVAQFAAMALTLPQMAGATIDIGGPENWTNMEVVRLYERLAGKRAKVSHVPLGMLRVMAGIVRPFHPGLSQVMKTSIWFDTTDQTFDPRPTLHKYPIPLTKLESWVEKQVESDLASVPAVAS
ncbi:MAG: SDR family oxidoreductase [Ardenticatenaceae bacterium]|nr:SDR family oxidoreductase [Ardenticatenaceae bacterium]MCB8975121.1 SDR family oxidoreductase [Ardenticatenaceae bacterium]